MMHLPKYKLVDLFCGCGGISRGFKWTGRFGTELGVEIEPHPAAAFAKNIRNTRGESPVTVCDDILKLVETESSLWRELAKAEIRSPGEIDVLAGGPPCQGFSRNGVRLYRDGDRSVRFYDDPRNHLYKAYLRVVEWTRPKIVLIENVREFLNFGQGKFSSDLVAKFHEMGYEVDFRKICTADYGVPQVRHRVFFVAIRNDVADRTGCGPIFPLAEFFEPGAQMQLGMTRTHRTVRDAISDLPTPLFDRDKALAYPGDCQVSDLALLLRRGQSQVFNHFARKLSPKQLDRIRAIGVGRMKHVDPKLQTRSFYGSAYRRLSWDEPALTITTWVYHVGSGRFAHPSEDRGITMREAARLQTFDDEFIFPLLVNPVSQMIGNAVPPLMANRFAECFTDILDRLDPQAESSLPIRGAMQVHDAVAGAAS